MGASAPKYFAPTKVLAFASLPERRLMTIQFETINPTYAPDGAVYWPSGEVSYNQGVSAGQAVAMMGYSPSGAASAQPGNQGGAVFGGSSTGAGASAGASGAGAVYGGAAATGGAGASSASNGGAGAGGGANAGTAAAPYSTVADLYTGILGRAGEQAGMDYWGSVFGDSVDANEYQQFLAASRPEMADNVGQLYGSNFGRDADAAGLQYWQDAVNSGSYSSMADLNAAFQGGRKGEDVAAYNDGAQYDRAWNSGLNADDNRLVYNAGQDRWEVKAGAVAAGGGGANYNADLNRAVDAKTMTIEGRINNILARDASGNYTNPVIQQAAMRARQSFAGRGLLNSSMSEQAALEAVTSKAIEIAGPDAQTYFAQGRANQDATNVFARDEQNFKYDKDKLATQHGYDLAKMGAANGYDLEKMSVQQGYDVTKLDKQLSLEREKLTQSGSQFNQELAYKYDSLKLSEENRLAAEQRAHQNALEIKNIDAVNSAYDLYLRRMSEIDNNKEFNAATKVAMKNAAGKDFDLYAKAKGITWQMSLGDRFTMGDVVPSGGGGGGGGSAGSGGNPNGGGILGSAYGSGGGANGSNDGGE